MPSDTAMICATLCDATALGRFGDQPPLGHRFVVASALGYGALSPACSLPRHDVGRHAVLNGGLAVNCGALAVLAAMGTRRASGALVLCRLDIDHFKRSNDNHGHAAGDAVPKGVAQTLTAQGRGGDLLAGLGGAEFLIGCRGADRAQALALAEGLRAAVEHGRHPVAGADSLHCTVSIGVSPVCHDRRGCENALRAADATRYQARQSGRNRVVAAAGPVDRAA